jgi:hypothetical protein
VGSISQPYRPPRPVTGIAFTFTRRTLEKRRWAKPGCISGIRNRDLKEQLHLGMERTSGRIFMRTIRQVVVLKIAKRAVESSVRLRKMIGHCGGLGPTHANEWGCRQRKNRRRESTDDCRKFCLTEKMVKWYTWTTWLFIGEPLGMRGFEEGARRAVAA